MIDYALRRLTRRQEKVLLFIDEYQLAHGYSPTCRDICAHIGASSPHAAISHRRALERKGMLEMQHYRGRTLRLTDKGREHARALRAEKLAREQMG